MLHRIWQITQDDSEETTYTLTVDVVTDDGLVIDRLSLAFELDAHELEQLKVQANQF